MALSLSFNGSLWLQLWLSVALTATLWHTLVLSGSLLLSNFAYTAFDWLTGPLLGSQRRCHDDALSPALLKAQLGRLNNFFFCGSFDESRTQYTWSSSLINKFLSSYHRYYHHYYHFSQSSVPIMALGGQFRVWPVEIGDGPRLVKLPPLLAPSKISYSKISKCISTKVYIFLAILHPAIKYFRLAL